MKEKRLISEPEWNKKQSEEAGQIRRFLTALVDSEPGHPLRGGELFAVNPDPPDLVWKLDTKEVGIEHRRIFREDEEMKIQEARREKLIEAARNFYEADAGPPICVSPIFRFIKLKKGQISDAGAKLAKIVLSEFRNDVGSKTIHPRDFDASQWPECIRSITVSRCEGQRESMWDKYTGEFDGELSTQTLEDAITIKSAGRETYKTVWPLAWLVLVSEQANHSSLFDIGDDILQNVFTSSFDRTFIWMHSCQRFYALKTTP